MAKNTPSALVFMNKRKILQPMWDKSLIRDFAKLNDFIVSLCLKNLGLRGDILVGINKFKLMFTPISLFQHHSPQPIWPMCNIVLRLYVMVSMY